MEVVGISQESHIYIDSTKLKVILKAILLQQDRHHTTKRNSKKHTFTSRIEDVFTFNKSKLYVTILRVTLQNVQHTVYKLTTTVFCPLLLDLNASSFLILYRLLIKIHHLCH